MKYVICFRLLPRHCKKPVMETGFLNLHDEEHFSTLPSPLYDQVLLVCYSQDICYVCFRGKRLPVGSRGRLHLGL